MNYIFLLKNSYQVILSPYQLHMLVETTDKYQPELNPIDGPHLLTSCKIYQPDLSAKLKSSEKLSQEYNFVVVQLTDIYKKYSQPYNLGCQSVKSSLLNFSKLYKFRSFRPTIHSDFSNSDFNKKILLVRGGSLSELLSVLAFVWFMNWLESMKLVQAFQPIKPPNHEILGSQMNSKPQSPGVCGSSQSGFYIIGEKTPGKNSPSYRTTLTTFDGRSYEASNQSLDHLLPKHGHTFGIDDRLPRNPDQKDNGYEDNKIRTRLNPENRDQFRENVNEFGKNPNLVPFYDVLIRNKPGDIYYCPITQRCIATQNDPVTGTRTLIKAQPMSPVQLDHLKDTHRFEC